MMIRFSSRVGLKAHLEIYDHFPGVGMVSGSPENALFDHAINTNLSRANEASGFLMHAGKRIPLDWEREWAAALGKDVPEYIRMVESLEDFQLEYRGKFAYATACHNQFLSPKSVLLASLQGPWSGRLMGGLNELDETIDASGYLRLTTPDRTTKLIGNVVTPDSRWKLVDSALKSKTAYGSEPKEPSELSCRESLRWLVYAGCCKDCTIGCSGFSPVRLGTGSRRIPNNPVRRIRDGTSCRIAGPLQAQARAQNPGGLKYRAQGRTRQNSPTVRSHKPLGLR